MLTLFQFLECIVYFLRCVLRQIFPWTCSPSSSYWWVLLLDSTVAAPSLQNDIQYLGCQHSWTWLNSCQGLRRALHLTSCFAVVEWKTCDFIVQWDPEVAIWSCKHLMATTFTAALWCGVTLFLSENSLRTGTVSCFFLFLSAQGWERHIVGVLPDKGDLVKEGHILTHRATQSIMAVRVWRQAWRRLAGERVQSGCRAMNPGAQKLWLLLFYLPFFSLGL